ncbi:MAG: HEAT repeat domain-containing protein [Thermodesulfovibrionales bacterium]
MPKNIVLLFLSLMLFFPPVNLLGMDSEEIFNELKTNKWETRLLNDKGIEAFKNKSNFDNLIGIIDNRGIDWRIRIRGIKLLGETRTPEAATNLVRMFNDTFFSHECPSIKSYVAAALGNYKDDTTVVLALIDGLKDREILVREESAKSLGRVGNPMAVPYLVEALKDRSFAVRINAIRSLALIGDFRAYPHLKQIMDDRQEDPVIRDAASSAVELLLAKKNSGVH